MGYNQDVLVRLMIGKADVSRLYPVGCTFGQ